MELNVSTVKTQKVGSFHKLLVIVSLLLLFSFINTNCMPVKHDDSQ